MDLDQRLQPFGAEGTIDLRRRGEPLWRRYWLQRLAAGTPPEQDPPIKPPGPDKPPVQPPTPGDPPVQPPGPKEPPVKPPEPQKPPVEPPGPGAPPVEPPDVDPPIRARSRRSLACAGLQLIVMDHALRRDNS